MDAVHSKDEALDVPQQTKDTMEGVRVRTFTKSLTQTLLLPFDTETALHEQCENEIIRRLRGVPFGWGMMIEPHLRSLKICDQFRVQTNGPKVTMHVPIIATYNVIGYIVGDVVFNVPLAEPISQDSTYSSFRRTNIIGIPFQVNVRVQSAVTGNNLPILESSASRESHSSREASGASMKSLNIQIVSTKLEGMLQYIANASFYPYYAPLASHLECVSTTPIGSRRVEDQNMVTPTSLYASVRPDLAAFNEPLTLIDNILIDPLFDMPPADRINCIIIDIRQTLNILPSGASRPEGSASKVIVINKEAALSGIMPKAASTPPKDGYETIIEFLHVNDVKAKHSSIGATKHAFVRVPSMPALSPIVAAVTFSTSSARTTDTKIATFGSSSSTPHFESYASTEQVLKFVDDVGEMIKFRNIERLANRMQYGQSIIEAKSIDDALKLPDSPQVRLFKEHIAAKNSVIATYARLPPRDAKTESASTSAHSGSDAPHFGSRASNAASGPTSSHESEESSPETPAIAVSKSRSRSAAFEARSARDDPATRGAARRVVGVRRKKIITEEQSVSTQPASKRSFRSAERSTQR